MLEIDTNSPLYYILYTITHPSYSIPQLNIFMSYVMNNLILCGASFLVSVIFLYFSERKIAFFYTLGVTSLMTLFSFLTQQWIVFAVMGIFPISVFLQFLGAWLQYSPAAARKAVKILEKEHPTDKELRKLYNLRLQSKEIFYAKLENLANFNRGKKVADIFDKVIFSAEVKIMQEKQKDVNSQYSLGSKY